MKKEIILCWIFCGFSVWGFSQKTKDYLLTLKKDTLFGKILTEKRGLAPIVFVYGKQKMNYYPSSIQFYGIFRDKTYQHFKTLKSKEGKAFFVQIIANGNIQLYKYLEKHIYTHSTLRRYVYLMGRSDEQLMTISSSNYQRILGDFLKEQPSLLSKLTTVSFAEVPQLIHQYNQL